MKSNVFYVMVLVMAIGVLNAGTISVSFCNETSLPGTGSIMDSADLAGAPGVRVGNWNNWLKDDGSLGDDGYDIIDDSGAVTALTASINFTASASRDNNHDNDQEMFSDVKDIFGSDKTLSVSNIPYDVYDVYVYMRDDGAGRAGVFTIGATTYYARGGAGNPASDGTGYVLSADTTLDDPTTIDQGNYVVFSAVSGSSFDLVINAVNAGDLDRNKVAGFQIVQVPEPATMMLLGLGSMALLRRKK